MQKIISNSLVAFLLTPSLCLAQASDLIELTRQDCDFIARYDNENDFSFISDFAFMAHHSDVNLECQGCTHQLRKRTLEIEISLVRNADLPSPNSVIGSVAQVIDIIRENTPISVSTLSGGEVNLYRRGTLVFVFVDDGNRQEIRDFFDDLPSFQRLVDATTIPGATCVLGAPEWSDVSEAAIVFFNAEDHRAPETVAECIREVSYNAMGLWADPQGDWSLFQNSLWRGEDLADPYYGFLVTEIV